MHRKNELISIGAIVKARGLKGEHQIIPFTDEPEQFKSIENIVVNINESRQNYKVEKVRFSGNKIYLKLEGVNDRTTAKALKGAYLEQKFVELRALSEDEYFIFDLIGLNVQDLSGKEIGTLTDVWTLTANDVYVVSDGKKEWLIPAIKDVIKQIDLGRKQIIIDPIDGLLD